MYPTTPSCQIQYLTVDSESSPEGSDNSSYTTAATTPAVTPAVLADILARHKLTEATLQKVQDVFIELAEASGITMVNAEHDVLVAAATKNNTSDLVSDYD
jgi:myo-inositol-1(or 4)-monophosphatase